jgi:TolA-binding protein
MTRSQTTISGGNMTVKKIKETQAISKFLILLSLFFPPVIAAHAETAVNQPGSLIIEPGEQFGFAEKYFNEGQYLRAIAEFERFLYFFPNDPRYDNALYKIGQSFFNIGRFKEAVSPFSSIIEKSDNKRIAVKACFRLSETFTAMEDYVSAMNVLDHSVKILDDDTIRDEVRYRVGWILLLQDQVDKALAHFTSVSGPNKSRFRIAEIEKELRNKPLYPQKNPGLAGFFSIVPGAGFAYCERYQDALVAFLLNTGLILASVKSFDDGNEALGAVIAFVGAGFYGGNIYGAISSAHKFNKSSKQRFLENLRARTGVTLSYIQEKKAFAAGFRYSF